MRHLQLAAYVAWSDSHLGHVDDTEPDVIGKRPTVDEVAAQLVDFAVALLVCCCCRGRRLSNLVICVLLMMKHDSLLMLQLLLLTMMLMSFHLKCVVYIDVIEFVI